MNDNHTTQTANPSPEHTLGQIKAAAGDGAQDASDLATREAARIGELARDWWQRNAKTAMDMAGSVKGEASALGDRTQRYVRDEPLRSVLVAAAAGALITGLVMMVSRRGTR